MEALRDAIGLARLLYAVERDEQRRAAIADAGAHLARALRFSQMEAGSLGRRAWRSNAEQGFDALAAVGWPPEIAAIIEAARRRV